MSNEYDFESDVVNTEQTNNGPINNGTGNNGTNNGNGGVPLIAIIGIMALIIVGLIVYIIVDPSATKEEPVIDVQESEVIIEDSVADEEVEENVAEEPVIKEDEDKDENEDEIKTPIEVNDNSSVELSSDWMDCEFAIEGKKYKLNNSYKTYTQDGWYIDLEKMGYAEGYILNKNDKTYSTIDLLNDNFEDADVSVGFINRGDNAQDITECDIWAINIDNSYSDTPISFELPGGVKNGATLADVEAAYGKPEDENDIYRSEDLGYTKYSYDYDYSIYFEVTVYDEEGLTEFGYKIYE